MLPRFTWVTSFPVFTGNASLFSLKYLCPCLAFFFKTVTSIIFFSDLSQVECSPDGQLVAVAARGGGVSVYLTKMPSMGAACGDTVAVLSSLNQVTYLPEGDKVGTSEGMHRTGYAG